MKKWAKLEPIAALFLIAILVVGGILAVSMARGSNPPAPGGRVSQVDATKALKPSIPPDSPTIGTPYPPPGEIADPTGYPAPDQTIQPAFTQTEPVKPTFTPLAPTEVTPTASAWQGQVIEVSVEPGFPPFENIDPATKQPVGYDIDLMNAIAGRAGFQVTYRNTPFDVVLTSVATCQNILAISGIVINEERGTRMDFSIPYINAGQVVLVPADASDIHTPQDLGGKRIGAQTATTAEIEARKVADAVVSAYDTSDLAVQALLNGELDAVILDYPAARMAIARDAARLQITGKQPFTDERYAIAICKKSAGLKALIDAALQSLIDDGTNQRLQDKWMGGQKPRLSFPLFTVYRSLHYRGTHGSIRQIRTSRTAG
jgi:polar amino acid transport system substrate-binding protein